MMHSSLMCHPIPNSKSMKSNKEDNRFDNIIIKYADKYYPDILKDWSERHRALAFVAEVLREIHNYIV